MALTEIPIELSSTPSIVDGGNATAITIASDESVTFATGADIITASAGTSNTRIGVNAGNSIASGGNYNVVVGDEAGTAITTGDSNVFVGYQSGDATTTADSNVGIGRGTLTTNILSDHNTAIGNGALFTHNQASSTDSYNTAVGSNAGASVSTGSFNTLLGGLSAGYITTGTSNSTLGYNTLARNTTGSNNIAVGNDALFSNTTASNNTAVGKSALLFNTTGADNVAVGALAGDAITTGTFNTYVGKDAGGAATTGSYNTFIGAGTIAGTGNFGAGSLMTTGSKNTIIGGYNGNQNSLDLRTASNNIVLSDGDGNPRGVFNSGGQYMVGGVTNANQGMLEVTQATTGRVTASFINSSGAPYGLLSIFTGAIPNNTTNYFFVGSDNNANRVFIYSNGNIVNVNNSYGAISDVKLKENIIDSSSQWEDIKALTVRKYSMKADNLDAPNMLGVVAQEVEAAGMGGLVFESPDRDSEQNDLGTVTKQVNYSILYMKAVKALQEAMDRIETLEAKVQTLENN